MNDDAEKVDRIAKELAPLVSETGRDLSAPEPLQVFPRVEGLSLRAILELRRSRARGLNMHELLTVAICLTGSESEADVIVEKAKTLREEFLDSHPGAREFVEYATHDAEVTKRYHDAVHGVAAELGARVHEALELESRRFWPNPVLVRGLGPPPTPEPVEPPRPFQKGNFFPAACVAGHVYNRRQRRSHLSKPSKKKRR